MSTLKRLKRKFILEKPRFNSFPFMVKFFVDSYCYILPTSCGHTSYGMQMKYENEPDIYRLSWFWLPEGWDFFWLWFRIHVRLKLNKEDRGLYKHAKWNEHYFDQKWHENKSNPS